MPDTSLSKLHQKITDLHAEIREEGSEFDFRYSLVDHLFTDALGWSRTEGEGHVNFEDDRKDVLCYDDSDPPFPVVACETKRPSHDLDLSDVEQLETYLNGIGSAKYGVLTNGHDFRLYEYDPNERELAAIDDFDIGDVATTELGELTQSQRNALSELEYLHRDRYVDLGDAETFRETYQEVPVQYQPGTDDEGYDLFLGAIKESLNELTEVMKRFFEDYREREEGSYPKSFLETTFPDWKEWREYTGKSENAKETFCRETAYIILNRALFARIAEDKEIVGHTRLSSGGMADELERDESRPYLDALMDTYDQIDNHYPDLYELGIFDWWWVSQDKRGQFDRDENRRQRTLEDEFDYVLGTILKRLNRFDFEYVNRDILGHVYEDYLPKQERKELGEYYTPIEVVRFMLDTIEYRPSEDIGEKKVLDPACGSGTFLTEVTERLIQWFLNKFDKENVHYLNSDEAQIILERIEDNIYGIDINPFAVHITQINLLFRTIDLYDKITERDPHYSMEGFEVHVADTLSPTVREKQQGGTDTAGEQVNLQQFAEYNGRASSFVKDRKEVNNLKDEEEFDLVVANPPYIRIQNINSMKETYSDRYASAIKNFDLYVPFVERGLEWLTDEGKLAYICPDRLVNADYAETIRNQLIEEPITHLIDFKESDVFDVPTPYPCIIALDRSIEDNNNQINYARFAENNDGVLDEMAHLEDWESSIDASGQELFKYSQNQLAEDNDGTPAIWKPMPDNEREVFDKIENQSDIRLGPVTNAVFQGIITGRDKLFVGKVIEDNKDGTVQFDPPESTKPYPVEKTILRRLLKGKEIERWKTDWSGLWVVFPYQVSDQSASVLDQATLKKHYPNAWDFFKSHEDNLKSRENGKWKDKEQWWAFSRKQNIEKFEQDKMMAGVLRQEPSFVPDTEGAYYFVGGGTAGGYGLHLRKEYAPKSSDTLYIGGLLNSRVVEFYHKHISFIFNSKYYSYGKTFLEPLPLIFADDEVYSRISALTKDIRDTVELITELEVKTSNILNYVSSFDRNSTILDLAQTINLGDDNYRQEPIRIGKTEPDSENAYRVVMKRGHTISFENEHIRDFVYKLLTAQNKRLGRSEILSMETPGRDDVLALIEEYKSDTERIGELEAETEDLQDDLDTIILRDVYDLNDEDIDVIDSFLDVW